MDTLYPLYLLGASLLGKYEYEHIPAADIAETASAVIESTPEPLLFPGERRFWMRQSYHEGRFAISPKGHNDAGMACGIVQVNLWMIPKSFGTCEDLRKSRALAISVARHMLKRTIAHCGSVRSGLGALFSGKCGNAQKLVALRCADDC